MIWSSIDHQTTDRTELSFTLLPIGNQMNSMLRSMKVARNQYGIIVKRYQQNLSQFSRFNHLLGQWDALNFPSPPPSRYGMAAASSMNGGLYIFGGFGIQGTSPNYNPYLSYASGQQVVNYNFETPPNFIQNPILMNNPDFINNPNYN
ncbi:unnamed protein product, partial [Rotaria socialis]